MKNVNPAPVYYFAETTSLPPLRKAEPLKARNLTAAKREARRKSAFEGTWVTVGTSVDAAGLLVSVVASYSPRDCRWYKLSCDFS